MLFTIYNQQGEELRKQEIDTFGIEKTKIVPALVHQVAVAYQANQRQPIAHTKTRGEVAGGGKKPWRQKGTGRARAGSIRSPLWVGGGIIFGPRKTRVFAKTITKTMRRRALAMILANCLKAGQFCFLDTLRLPELKTKQTAGLLHRLPANQEKKQKNALFIFNRDDGELGRAVRNLPRAKAIQAKDADLISLLWANRIITTPAAFSVLLKRCVKTAAKQI